MSISASTGIPGKLPGLKILNVEDILFTTVEAICQDSLLQILNNDHSSKNYAIDRICELVTDSFSASKSEAMVMMEEKIKNLYGTIHEFRKQVYDLKEANSNYRKGIENLNQELLTSQGEIRRLREEWEEGGREGDLGVLVEENKKLELLVCEVSEMNSGLRNEVFEGKKENKDLMQDLGEVTCEYEEKIELLEFGNRGRRVLSSECVKLESKLKDMESYFVKNESKKKLKMVT